MTSFREVNKKSKVSVYIYIYIIYNIIYENFPTKPILTASNYSQTQINIVVYVYMWCYSMFWTSSIFVLLFIYLNIL